MNRKVLVGLCSVLIAVAGCVLFLGRSAAQSSAAASRITQAVDESRLTFLRGNTHLWARPQFDQGVVPPDMSMGSMLLILRGNPGQEAAAQKLLADQHDKASPNYHKWLTPQEFGARFGASDADITAVKNWLESHGFSIEQVMNGRSLVQFSGTAGQVSAAFHTDIHNYLVNGQTHWSNASDPAIPSALAPAVVGVASLNNFPRIPASHFYGNFRRTKPNGHVVPVKKDFTLGRVAACRTVHALSSAPAILPRFTT